MLEVVAIRFGAGLLIGEEKQRRGLPVLDADRENELLFGAEETGIKVGLRSEFSRSIVQSVMDECRLFQEQNRH